MGIACGMPTILVSSIPWNATILETVLPIHMFSSSLLLLYGPLRRRLFFFSTPPHRRMSQGKNMGRTCEDEEPSKIQLDDRVARKQVGGREQIEGKKSEVTEDE